MKRLCLLSLALLLVGCASLPGRAPSTASSRPSAAGSVGEASDPRVAQLQRQAAMAEAEIKLLRRQLAALQVEVERLSERAERAGSPPPRVSPPVARPASPIESSDLEPVRVEPRVEPLDRPVPPAGSDASADFSRAPREPITASAPLATVPPAGQSIYDRGYTLYHQGRYVDAESSFQRFLQAHGDTELADNAQFWIGESRFARNDYMGALLAFEEVLDRYPTGNKVADALLKSGDCLVQLDNRETGRERYEEVLRRFPGSAASAMAEERLNRPGG